MTVITTGYSIHAPIGEKRNRDGAGQDDGMFRQALAGLSTDPMKKTEPAVSGLPYEPTPDVSGLPCEPVPEFSGLPFERVPELSGLPVEPAPDISGLPFERMPELSGLPVEPVPEISGLPVEPSPKDDIWIDPLILMTHRLGVELATRFFDLQQSASESSGAASDT